MPPPSQLAIATSSLNRLLKEETSYSTELTNQRKRVAQLQASGRGDGDEEEHVGNLEFQLRQEERGIAETEAVFEPLRERIDATVEKVKGMLETGASNDANEIEAAKDAVERSTYHNGDPKTGSVS